MLDKKLFIQMMAMLCEIYEREQKESIMDIYYLVLSEMSNDDFKNSIVEILKTRKYATLPKPAEILEYSRLNIEALAILAIDDIERAISRHGAYASITFEDSVINSIIDHLGGWVSVCGMESSEWKWAKKEIPKMYDIYSKRANHPEHLIGIAENNNGVVNNIAVVQAGYETKKVNTVALINPRQSNVNGSIANLVQKVRVQ